MQTGHVIGVVIGVVFVGLRRTCLISGITSFARCTRTSDPILTSMMATQL